MHEPLGVGPGLPCQTRTVDLPPNGRPRAGSWGWAVPGLYWGFQCFLGSLQGDLRCKYLSREGRGCSPKNPSQSLLWLVGALQSHGWSQVWAKITLIFLLVLHPVLVKGTNKQQHLWLNTIKMYVSPRAKQELPPFNSRFFPLLAAGGKRGKGISDS